MRQPAEVDLDPTMAIRADVGDSPFFAALLYLPATGWVFRDVHTHDRGVRTRSRGAPAQALTAGLNLRSRCPSTGTYSRAGAVRVVQDRHAS